MQGRPPVAVLRVGVRPGLEQDEEEVFAQVARREVQRGVLLPASGQVDVRAALDQELQHLGVRVGVQGREHQQRQAVLVTQVDGVLVQEPLEGLVVLSIEGGNRLVRQ
jgi:hypothetical protein